VFKNTYNVKPLRLNKKITLGSTNFKPPAKIKTIPIVPVRTPLPRRPNKDLSYPQAKKLYGRALSPFGNWDGDKHINMFDCRPFDRTRHKVPEEFKDRPVTGYTRPATFKTVFADAEEQMPSLFKGQYEETYSKLLTDALLEREDIADVQEMADVVGTYEIPGNRVPAHRVHVKMLHDEIKAFLEQAYPEYVFHFKYDKPKYVDVDIYTNDKETGKPIVKKIKDQKLGKYLTRANAPEIIQQLNTLYETSKGVTIVITDYPIDVLRKATGHGRAFDSCETLPENFSGTIEEARQKNWYGGFSDIANRNAIAWFFLEGKTPGIDKPTARVMIRWGLHGGKVDINMERTIYPKTLNKFYLNFVKEILLNKGYGKYKITTPYEHEGYGDIRSGRGQLTYGPLTAPDATWKEPEPTPQALTTYKKEIMQKKRLAKPLMYSFVKDPNEEIRRELAERGGLKKNQYYEYEDLPRALKARFANDPSTNVRIGLIKGQKELEPEIVNTLARGPSDVQRTLLKRPDIAPDMLHKFSENPELYQDLVRRPDTPVEILQKIAFAEESGYEVRNAKEELAKRPNLPIDWIIALAKTGGEETLVNLARTQNLKPKALEPVVDRMLSMESTSIDKALAYNINVPPKVPIKLISSPDFEVREGIIVTTGLPPELIRYLATDSSVEFRKAVARTPALYDTPDVMLKLAKDRSVEIKGLIAERPDITPDAAKAILSTGQKELLLRLAVNPFNECKKMNAEEKYRILEHIAYKKDPRLITELAHRPDLNGIMVKRILNVLNSNELKRRFAEEMRAAGTITEPVQRILRQQGLIN